VRVHRFVIGFRGAGQDERPVPDVAHQRLDRLDPRGAGQLVQPVEQRHDVAALDEQSRDVGRGQLRVLPGQVLRQPLVERLPERIPSGQRERHQRRPVRHLAGGQDRQGGRLARFRPAHDDQPPGRQCAVELADLHDIGRPRHGDDRSRPVRQRQPDRIRRGQPAAVRFPLPLPPHLATELGGRGREFRRRDGRARPAASEQHAADRRGERECGEQQAEPALVNHQIGRDAGEHGSRTDEVGQQEHDTPAPHPAILPRR
jgi:hypothetical protein